MYFVGSTVLIEEVSDKDNDNGHDNDGDDDDDAVIIACKQKWLEPFFKKKQYIYIN